MTEPEPTGYHDSPDTTDTAAGARDTGAPADDDAPLTTDADAQREDSVARPGNEPD